MKEKILLIWKHLKQGTLKKMWKQTLWIYQYGRRYWKAMILYTLLGLVGTGVSLVSSLISKDLVDIITGHQTGKLVSTFAAMIGFSVANILVSQVRKCQVFLQHFFKKIFNIVYLLFIIYNDIIRLQLQLFLSSFLKKCIEKRLSSGSHFLYAPLSFILLIFPFH